MSDIDSADLTRVARDAALAVGDQLRTAFRHRPQVEHKRNFHDLVTEHDRAAERGIRDHILREFPESVICGEEGGTEGSGRLSWYVDPIDGTSNFARGLPFFCVSIGCVVDGEMVSGVVYDPIREEVFTASADGAWVNDEPLSSVGARTDGEALITSIYPTYHHMTGPNRDRALGHFEDLVRAFGTYRRPGCVALSLAYVAAGRTDAALGVGVHPWDVAAGLLLVRKAGGRYRPLPMSERPDPWLERGYVATVGTFDLESSVLQRIVDDLS